jgi:hypothetical protein
MRSVVTKLDSRSITLMMTAAVTSSFRVLATRPRGAPSVRGLCPRSLAPPSMSGMTVTPVSNPERPRASLGKTRSAPATTREKSPFAARAERQSPSSVGWASTSHAPRPRTTRFRAR